MNLRRSNLRRFLRFRLRTLLLLPAVFAAIWWWVTWPERTARRFVSLLAAGDFEAAQAMFESTQPFEEFFWPGVSKANAFPLLTFRGSRWVDLATGRREFNINPSLLANRGGASFVALRGRVVVGPKIAIYPLKNAPAQDVANTLGQMWADCANSANCQFGADVRSNCVVVRAPADICAAVSEQILQLDAAPPETLRGPIVVPLSPEDKQKLRLVL
jgi:hypothetical protein